MSNGFLSCLVFEIYLNSILLARFGKRSNPTVSIGQLMTHIRSEWSMITIVAAALYPLSVFLIVLL